MTEPGGWFDYKTREWVSAKSGLRYPNRSAQLFGDLGHFLTVETYVEGNVIVVECLCGWKEELPDGFGATPEAALALKYGHLVEVANQAKEGS